MSALPAERSVFAHDGPAPGGRWFVVLVALLLTLVGCERTQTVQHGFRGTGMLQVYDGQALAASADQHQIPPPEPTDPPDPEAPAIKDVFKNVQVLDDLTVLEFSRLMQAMSTWIAPDEGCEFCHNPKKLESDEKYTKVVARRMLQMTRQINSEWKTHVAATGVTCWTCHRGQAVPSGDWFRRADEAGGSIFIGQRAHQNTAGIGTNGNTSLPFDPLSAYLSGKDDIRVQGVRALAGENRRSIKQTEWTYSLMIYMSNSLGVNCSYCHNTRALANWSQSSPQRSTAWYGIRMVRSLNNDYLTPMTSLFPAHRLSPEGDGPKVGCPTCHKGAFKPLYGVSMLGDYPELRGVYPPRDPAASQPSAAASAAVVAQAEAPAR